MAKSYKRKPKTGYKRKCHDCGKPTNAYRCPECWAKIRRNGGYASPESAHNVLDFSGSLAL